MKHFLFCLVIFFSMTLSSATAQHTKLTAIVWLSTDCPLSQKYSRTINLLKARYTYAEVHWMLVFVNEKKKFVEKFVKKYALEIPYILDKNKTLTKQYQATITPEAVLVAEDKIVYRGAIDNQVLALGKFADSATACYLQAAIDSVLSGRPIAIAKTTPIGCIIE